jgi:uncharacterized protein YciI
VKRFRDRVSQSSVAGEPERFSLVLLRRPTPEPVLGRAELEDVQERHLAYLDELQREGALVAAGGLANAPDASWTGMILVRADLREARALAARDPFVAAGLRLAEVATWLVPAGLLPT